MRSLYFVAVFVTLPLYAAAQPASERQQASGERLGLRAGYVQTTSGLDGSFGAGVNLAIHFIPRIRHPFYVDVTLGAHYLGNTSRRDITNRIFGPTTDEARMRVINFTVAPMLEIPVNPKTNWYVTAGVGLYTVSLLLESGLFAADISDNHLGLNAGTGAFVRLSQNWLLDFNFQAHRFWTSREEDDLFYQYSEGDRNPYFYQVNVGALLRLR